MLVVFEAMSRRRGAARYPADALPGVGRTWRLFSLAQRLADRLLGVLVERRLDHVPMEVAEHRQRRVPVRPADEEEQRGLAGLELLLDVVDELAVHAVAHQRADPSTDG